MVDEEIEDRSRGKGLPIDSEGRRGRRNWIRLLRHQIMVET